MGARSRRQMTMTTNEDNDDEKYDEKAKKVKYQDAKDIETIATMTNFDEDLSAMTMITIDYIWSYVTARGYIERIAFLQIIG